MNRQPPKDIEYPFRDSAPSVSVVTASDLSIGFPSGSLCLQSGLSFSLRKGRFYCLIGPNGSGKTTLLRTLAGLQRALSGQIMITGKDITRWKPKELARILALLLTQGEGIERMTAWDVAAMGRMPYTGLFGRLHKYDKDLIREALLQTGMHGRSQQNFNTLSDGEKQKVLIARALCQKTPLILMDEPAAFLDFPSRILLMQLLAQLARTHGLTILITTHDVSLALRMADEVLLLEKGKPLAAGIPEELILNGILSAYFHYDTIHFDPYQMEFLTPAKQSRPVLVEGDQHTGRVLGSFLQKCGCRMVQTGEPYEFRIHIPEKNHYLVNHNGIIHTFNLLSDLETYLKND